MDSESPKRLSSQYKQRGFIGSVAMLPFQLWLYFMTLPIRFFIATVDYIPFVGAKNASKEIKREAAIPEGKKEVGKEPAREAPERKESSVRSTNIGETISRYAEQPKRAIPGLRQLKAIKERGLNKLKQQFGPPEDLFVSSEQRTVEIKKVEVKSETKGAISREELRSKRKAIRNVKDEVLEKLKNLSQLSEEVLNLVEKDERKIDNLAKQNEELQQSVYKYKESKNNIVKETERAQQAVEEERKKIVALQGRLENELKKEKKGVSLLEQTLQVQKQEVEFLEKEINDLKSSVERLQQQKETTSTTQRRFERVERESTIEREEKHFGRAKKEVERLVFLESTPAEAASHLEEGETPSPRKAETETESKEEEKEVPLKPKEKKKKKKAKKSQIPTPPPPPSMEYLLSPRKGGIGYNFEAEERPTYAEMVERPSHEEAISTEKEKAPKPEKKPEESEIEIKPQKERETAPLTRREGEEKPLMEEESKVEERKEDEWVPVEYHKKQLRIPQHLQDKAREIIARNSEVNKNELDNVVHNFLLPPPFHNISFLDMMLNKYPFLVEKYYNSPFEAIQKAELWEREFFSAVSEEDANQLRLRLKDTILKTPIDKIAEVAGHFKSQKPPREDVQALIDEVYDGKLEEIFSILRGKKKLSPEELSRVREDEKALFAFTHLEAPDVSKSI